jgi:hypothetical protein
MLDGAATGVMVMHERAMGGGDSYVPSPIAKLFGRPVEG